MQQKKTDRWKPLIPQATRAHNRMMHEALMGNADPNEAYDQENKNLAFELRGEAGKKMAQQDAVVTQNQKTFASKAASERTSAAKTRSAGATDRNIPARCGW